LRAGSRTQGALSNDKDPLTEPVDHAIGRSRGGLTTKIHSIVDGHGRPLVILVTGGQAHDSPVLPALLQNLAVPRVGPGRPRTRPDALLAGKAYGSRAHRDRLRAAKILVVIPEKSNSITAREARGQAGGRPFAFDAELYKPRNVVERSYNTFKQWRSLATRYDKLAVIYRGVAVLNAILTWLKALGDSPSYSRS
jgi:transposase